MFGNRYFGNRYFGDRYFGPAQGAVLSIAINTSDTLSISLRYELYLFGEIKYLRRYLNDVVPELEE